MDTPFLGSIIFSYLTVSEQHTFWGEVFGIGCWLWVFHRARHDLPVVLGWRHPWDHVDDPFALHPPSPEKQIEMKEGWDKFTSKAIIQKEDDDDDDEDDE